MATTHGAVNMPTTCGAMAMVMETTLGMVTATTNSTAIGQGVVSEEVLEEADSSEDTINSEEEDSSEDTRKAMAIDHLNVDFAVSVNSESTVASIPVAANSKNS